jgi:hypothetical protein
VDRGAAYTMRRRGRATIRPSYRAARSGQFVSVSRAGGRRHWSTLCLSSRDASTRSRSGGAAPSGAFGVALGVARLISLFGRLAGAEKCEARCASSFRLLQCAASLLVDAVLARLSAALSWRPAALAGETLPRSPGVRCGFRVHEVE